jgi:hypothetical protein
MYQLIDDDGVIYSNKKAEEVNQAFDLLSLSKEEYCKKYKVSGSGYDTDCIHFFNYSDRPPRYKGELKKVQILDTSKQSTKPKIFNNLSYKSKTDILIEALNLMEQSNVRSKHECIKLAMKQNPLLIT